MIVDLSKEESEVVSFSHTVLLFTVLQTLLVDWKLVTPLDVPGIISSSLTSVAFRASITCSIFSWTAVRASVILFMPLSTETEMVAVSAGTVTVPSPTMVKVGFVPNAIAGREAVIIMPNIITNHFMEIPNKRKLPKILKARLTNWRYELFSH